MSRNEINKRPTSYRCYQDKTYPKAENDNITYTISKLKEASGNCAPKPEMIYTLTYKQLLVNCLRRDGNLLTIRDFINGTLNTKLVSAIDNEMTIDIVSDGIAKNY